MITEWLSLSIAYKRLTDCRKSSALCNAPLHGWHSRAELFEERNVLCGEALQGLTARRARPQDALDAFLLVMVIGNETPVSSGRCMKYHTRRLFCAALQEAQATSFVKGKQSKLIYTISFQIASSLVQLLR